MEDIKIEDVYYSYMRNGIIRNWRIDLVFKDESSYECFFTNTVTGEKKIVMLSPSENERVNHSLEAIFCD